MLPYRITITYYKNILELNILILDDIIMTKTFTIVKQDNKYMCVNEFKYEEFEHLIHAMKNNISYSIMYHGNDSIQYNHEEEEISFITQYNNLTTTFNINLFNNDNDKNKNSFINEFEKVSKFISCVL